VVHPNVAPAFFALALSAGRILPAAGAGDEAPFFFVHLSDPQLGFFDENRTFHREVENLRRTVEHLNRLRPALVVITGDLINKPGDGAQAEAYLKAIRTVDPSIPVHSISGNHDVENAPTAASLAWYRSTFGPDRGTFAYKDCRFIFFNSTLLHSPKNCPKEAEDERSWLAAELKRARRETNGHIFVLQHHPWFVETPDEADSYHAIPRADRQKLLPVLREARVTATLAGHLHRCAEARDERMQVLVAGPVGKPLGKDPSGLRIVWVFADRIEHRYYGLDEVPAGINLRGPRDRRRL